MRRPSWIVAAMAAALLAACASGEPAAGQPLDDSAGRVVVGLLADGFCTLDGVRMPFDAMVLRLRVRSRALADDERPRFVVEIRAPAPSTPEVRDAVQRDLDRLVQQLNVMDVVQVEYR